jgi:hypothetical protein
MPTDDEEADTESDAAIRRRRRRNVAIQSSSSEHNSDEGPSQARKSSQAPAQRAAVGAAYQKIWDDAPDKSKIVARRDRPKGVGSISTFQRFLKDKREEEGLPSPVRPGGKAAREKALTNLWENDPDSLNLSVKELVERFQNNPNNADIPATLDTVKRFRAEYMKRKETEPASNPRSNPKEKTKKKRKK